MQAFGVGKDGVGEVVVLIDKKVNILSGAFALMIKEVELVDGSFYCVQLFFGALRQKIGIDLAEIVETDLSVRIQSLAVVVQLTGDAGKVEVEHEISIATRRGVLADVEVAEQCFELVAGAHVVVLPQQVQRQALPKTARTDEEEKAVRLLYQRNEAGLIHILIIVEADVGKVHHAVGKSLSAGY